MQKFGDSCVPTNSPEPRDGGHPSNAVQLF